MHNEPKQNISDSLVMGFLILLSSEPGSQNVAT